MVGSLQHSWDMCEVFNRQKCLKPKFFSKPRQSSNKKLEIEEIMITLQNGRELIIGMVKCILQNPLSVTKEKGNDKNKKVDMFFETKGSYYFGSRLMKPIKGGG